MVVVIQQAPGIQQPELPLHLLCQALNEAAVILLVEEDRLLPAPARGGVVSAPGTWSRSGRG
jgi:hypothetical protein